MNRHLSRTVAMQIMFEWDFRSNAHLNEIVSRSIERFGEDVDKEYVITTVEGMKKHHDEIDAKILEVAPDWPIEQIASVDKAVLRLSIYELLFVREIPPKVAINEAVELAKTFGGENSSKFVNGVLGTIYRDSDRYDPDQEEVIKSADEAKSQ